MRKLLFIAAFLAALLPCGPGSGLPSVKASEIREASPPPQLSLQTSGKDVAVTSIAQVGLPYVNEGGTVTIDIGVSNNGTEQETFSVSLRDDTANSPIGSIEVTLAASSSTTISIAWDTTGATGGPKPPDSTFPGAVHVLKATAVLVGDTVPENDSKTLYPDGLPGIYVIAAPTAPAIEFQEGKEPAVWETSNLASEHPALNTEVAAAARIYAGPIRGQRTLLPSIPAISTDSTPLGALFREGARSEEEGYLRQPDIATVVASDETVTIRGRIKLEGRESSLGSYVEVDGQVTFADRQGRFLIQRPAGSFDLAIKAAGYLSVDMYNLNVETGEALVVPVVTLPFGDADGNGVIDIYDLTVAAGNYGQTVADLQLR